MAVFLDPDLTRTADLRNADLRGARVAHTDLFRVDLRGARMDRDFYQLALSMNAFLLMKISCIRFDESGHRKN